MKNKNKKPILKRLTSAENLRRLFQILFFVLFLWGFLQILPIPGEGPSPAFKLFFLFDPLIALSTTLASHAFAKGALLALFTIILTVLLGRVFCGWICPLGAIHTFFSFLTRKWKLRKKGANDWTKWHLTKYYLLVALLVMTLFGVNWVGVFDPISLLYRSVVTGVMPAVQWAVEDGATGVYQADPGIASMRLKSATEPFYAYMRDNIFNKPDQAFLGGGFVLALFVLTIGLNAWKPRFWCRYICPLGALLGVFSLRPVWRRSVPEKDCTGCDVCGLDCQGGASSSPGTGWKSAECLGCMSCNDDSCPQQGLSFKFQLPWVKPEGSDKPVDVSRRALLASGVGGIAAVAIMRVTPAARGTVYNPALIRPPGSLAEREFLSKCISCGLCMKICPNGAIHPTLLEAGLEGIWTPRIVPQIGYCSPGCTRCGNICPTGAIKALTGEEKSHIKLGLAVFDTTRCIPYAYGRECMVCEEHCPVADKAIYFIQEEIISRDGNKITLSRPRVDADKCIGCGICENVCPFKDKPAIRVVSANETRHPNNQPILPQSYGGYGY